MVQSENRKTVEIKLNDEITKNEIPLLLCVEFDSLNQTARSIRQNLYLLSSVETTARAFKLTYTMSLLAPIICDNGTGYSKVG